MNKRVWVIVAIALGCGLSVRSAPVSWDGGGGADSRWTTAANWSGDTLPAFDGSDDVTITTVHAAGTLMDLDGDKHINSLTSANGSPNFIISNSTLRVNTFIRKSNEAQIRIEADVEIDGTLLLQSYNATGYGIYMAGQIREASPGSGVAVQNSVGNVWLLHTNNTYSGETVVRRGALSLFGNTPAVGPGVAGIANGPILLGDEETGANNWSVELQVPNGISVARAIRVVATGSAVIPVVNIPGNSGTRDFPLLLDRDVQIRYGQPGNGTYSGFITGTGGVERIGGTETLTLSCVTNDFSGDVRVSGGELHYAIAAETNALGTASTPVVIPSNGGSLARGIRAVGTGVFSRDIVLLPGAPSSRSVFLGLASGGPVLYTGELAMNTPDAVYFMAPNYSSVEFSGYLCGTSTPIRTGSHTGGGNRICLSNPTNTFAGQIELGNGCLFVGADAPRGGPGALGAHTTINLNAQTGGVNSPALLTEGPYTIGQDIDIPSTGFTGLIYLGGAAAGTHTRFTGDILLARTNGVAGYDVRLAAGAGGLATFSGKLSGPGDWALYGGWPSAFASGGGDVEFTNPENTFSGRVCVLYGHLRVAATGADGEPDGGFILGSGSARSGVLTSGPATVRRGGSVYSHINATGECTLGGVTPHESRFTGDFTFDRLTASARAKNYLFATNDATVHFDGTLAAGAGHTLTKRGPGRVNINGALQIPAFTITAGILGGSGTLTNKLTFGGGTTFSPGSPLGSLTVGNSVVMNAGSTFLVQLARMEAGQAEVSGDVTLAHGVTITAPDRPCLNQVILRYHGTLSGAFSVTNLPSSAHLSYTVREPTARSDSPFRRRGRCCCYVEGGVSGFIVESASMDNA